MQPEEIDKLIDKFNLGFWKGKRDCHTELDKLYKEDLVTYIIMKRSPLTGKSKHQKLYEEAKKKAEKTGDYY